jgi:hypothetical protein
MANDADDPIDSDEAIARRLCDAGFERDEHGHFAANGCSVWVYRHHKGDWRIDIRTGEHYFGCRLVPRAIWSRRMEPSLDDGASLGVSHGQDTTRTLIVNETTERVPGRSECARLREELRSAMARADQYRRQLLASAKFLNEWVRRRDRFVAHVRRYRAAMLGEGEKFRRLVNAYNEHFDRFTDGVKGRAGGAEQLWDETFRALLKARDENVERSRKDPRSRAEPGEQFWDDTFRTLATARDYYRSIDEQLVVMNKTFREDLGAETSKLALKPIQDEPPGQIPGQSQSSE